MESKSYFDRKELIAAIAKESGRHEHMTAHIFLCAQDVIAEKIKEHQEIRIEDFGTFKRVLVPKRMHRNPKTQEPVVKPAHFKVKFIPAKKFKAAVQ